MKNRHIHADLMAQYVIDAQHTDRPWELWENQDGNGYWGVCCSSLMRFDGSVRLRRKHDAPYYTMPERVCEWEKDGLDGYSCQKLIRPLDFHYCPDCGGKVVIKEPMCKLGGIEFPVPVKWEDAKPSLFYVSFPWHVEQTDEHTYLWKRAYDEGLIQLTEAGAEQQLKAMQAAIKQAIEEAK